MSHPPSPLTTRGWGFRLASLLMFLVAPVMIAAAALLLLGSLERQNALRRSVEQSYETRIQIQRVYLLMQAVETGQRGFVISGKEEFLEPYYTAVGDLASQLLLLDRLSVDDPAQRAHMTALRRQVAVKLSITGRTIGVYRDGNPAAAAGRISSGAGRTAMNAIRETVRAMIAAEQESLRLRLAAADAAAERTRRLSLVLIALLLAILPVAGYLGARHVRTRQILLERLNQQSQRQSAIFENTIDAMVILNPSGSIETVNRAAEAMFGRPRDELLRRDSSVLLDLAGGEGAFLQRLAEAGQDGQPDIPRVLTARRRDGSEFPVEVALGSMPLADGVHVVAAIRDISDRQAAQRMKDEFVSTVSHELRTPLTSIAGSLGLLQGGVAGALPEKAARLVAIAKQSCDRLVRLINDLLDIQKLEAGSLELRQRPVDLRETIERAVDGIQGFAGEHKVRVRVTAPGQAVEVQGDADRLIQVLTNLLSNAIKFSPPGESVELSLAEEGGRAVVLVRDHGPGVPEHFKGSLFGKFAQADSSHARGIGGSGLGLAISREIVERHGGRLNLAAADGPGALFRLDLPLRGVSPPKSHAPARVLVCEDDAQAAETVDIMLREKGLEVDCVSSLAEAREALRAGRFDALVLDLHLPDGHGLSLLRELRAGEHRRLPVVVITGDTSASLKGGVAVADWISKPFESERLQDAVTEAIANRPSGDILLVEDDPDLVELVRASIGEREVERASTLAEARAALGRRRPDLVVLDIGLPDGSGLELLEDIARISPSPMVVIHSAQEVEESVRTQVDAVLTKSRVSLHDLCRTIETLVSARETA